MLDIFIDKNSKESQEIIKLIAQIEGWLFDNEALMLFNVAKKIEGIIVEIGSWKGKSTVCLAKGSEFGNKAKIYAVDPHIGTVCHNLFSGGKNTLAEFLWNLDWSGTKNFVIPVVKTSADVAKEFDHSIDFLFIDGDHSYRSVKEDFELWFPKLSGRGIIAFHDAVHPEIKKLIDEKASLGCFSEFKLVDRTAFAVKSENVKYKKKHKASLSCLLRNENRYIIEWILYHKAIGIDHFYIYDNESEVPLDNFLDKYKEFVTIINWPGLTQQLEAYNHCIKNFKQDSEWMAALDPDEFISFNDNFNSIKEVLSIVPEDADGLMLNWRMFGPNGHEKRQEGFVIDNYTTRIKMTPPFQRNFFFERFFKTFIKAEGCYDSIHGVHSLDDRPLKLYFGNSKDYIYSTKLLKTNAPVYIKSIDRKVFRTNCDNFSFGDPDNVRKMNSFVVWINHYWTKSFEDFSEKQRKNKFFYSSETSGFVPFPAKCTTEDIKTFFSQERVVEDASSTRFSEKVKNLAENFI